MSTASSCSIQSTDNLGMLLSLVKAELVRALEQKLSDEGIDLRFSQFQTLMRLHACGAMGAGELARSLCHDGGAMTRLLDQLQDKGYLYRQPHVHDRRALCIDLTEDGKALVKRMRMYADDVLDSAQAVLDSQERDQLTHFLQRILGTLRQVDGR